MRLHLPQEMVLPPWPQAPLLMHLVDLVGDKMAFCASVYVCVNVKAFIILKLLVLEETVEQTCPQGLLSQPQILL